MPNRNRPYQFFVTQEFLATVNGSRNQYHPGHAYTVREGKAWDDLDSKVDEWVTEGKAVLIR
jgi:hypothetical protein